MSDRGFGFTRATIWKIETCRRQVGISEGVALCDALDLSRWFDLTSDPEVGQPLAQLQSANHQARQAYTALQAAAMAYLEAQEGVLFAMRTAQDAGLDVVASHWGSRLDMPAERAVIEARDDHERDDEVLGQKTDRAEAALDALRRAGYEPLRPEDVVISGQSPE